MQAFLELQQQSRNSTDSSGLPSSPRSVLSRLRANLPRAKTQMERSGSLSTTALMRAASSGALPDIEFLTRQFTPELPLEPPLGKLLMDFPSDLLQDFSCFDVSCLTKDGIGNDSCFLTQLPRYSMIQKANRP